MMDPNVHHLLLLALSILVVTLGLSKFLLRMPWPSLKPRDNTPPGTCGLPILGETLSFFAANNTGKGFYEFVRARRLRHGNCFKTNILGRTNVFVSTTEAAKFVLGNDLGIFRKNYVRSISELLGEHSVLCATDNHRFLRHHIGAILTTTEKLSSFVRLFDKLTTDALGKWKEEKNVVIFDEALKITFRAMCQMLMSLDKEDELQVLQKDVFLICQGMLAIPFNIPFTNFYRGLKARERIMKTLERVIHDRRNCMETYNDLLEPLLNKNATTPCDTLTDAQIQDNILTMIIAGQITTASAFAWMVKYLDENKDVQEKLRDLHLRISAANPESQLIGMQTLNEMSYASKVVKETLRMATIVSWFPMITTKDCDIEGFHVKKGWVVNVDARCVHNDEIIYKDSAKFLPSRFVDDPKPYNFLAFGAGATACLGRNFAQGMMLVFLHRLVTTYRWKVTNPDPSLKRGALFPRLESGCPIVVAPI